MLALALLVAFPVEFLPDSGLFANTFFHVACLAEQINCSKGEIEHFWAEELEWRKEERNTLASLQSFLNGVGNAAPDPGPVAVPPNFPGYYPSYRRRYELLNRVLEAGSSDGIADAVSELLEPPDAQQLQHTVAQFEERLRPWWEATGRDLVAGYDKKLLGELDSADLGDLSGQIAAFVEARIERLGLHVIRSPNRPGRGSMATVMGRHVFIEVLVDDTLIEGVWKVLHELTHLLYENGPAEKHRSLIGQFLAADQPHSLAHYTLLNEGLATALHLIVYERLGLPEEDFYKDPYIPRIALATRPVLKKALAEGSTLYSEFATEYMRAVDTELGEEVRRPRYMLVGTAVLGLDEHPAAASTYMKLLPPRSSTRSEEDVERFPEFNVVRLLTFDELDSIEELLPDDALSDRRGFAYSPVPTSKRRDYWLAGRDDEALVDVIEKFAALEDVTGSGLLVTID